MKDVRSSQTLDGKALVAVDLGAESCRVSLLRWVDGEPRIHLVHRFPNDAVVESGGLRWDLNKILVGVEHGLRLCAELAPQRIASIGVDGWAVDYVRLRPDGTPAANPFCYRDERNIAALKALHERIPPERLYDLTGIQILPLNTLYQLFADGPSGTTQSMPWINLPEFVLHWLGGRRVAEHTNAANTQLVDVHTRHWCAEVFAATGLEINAAPPLVNPGSDIGQVTGALASLPAYRDTRLIAPACHDTASAIAGIPAEGGDWAFISSGTWSLVGCVLDSACVSKAARTKNFSNEAGIGGRIRFLKNVIGMWLLRQCMERWKSQGRAWTVDELLAACERLPAPDQLFDVDDPDFLPPGNMLARINAQLVRAGGSALPEEPESAPRVAQIIFHSLAARYAQVLRDLTDVTGKTFRRIFVVGGGSRNTLLNRLTERATGMQVLTGSAESTTIGNFAIQLAALEDSRDQAGVTSSAVAGWAGRLAEQTIEIFAGEVHR
jgi:rhamnulokinase